VPGDALAARDPVRSARVAAFASVPLVRFALRRPGREFGRFSSTPPSSVMGHESSAGRARYSIRRFCR
jgi:hypothetical protein